MANNINQRVAKQQLIEEAWAQEDRVTALLRLALHFVDAAVQADLDADVTIGELDGERIGLIANMTDKLEGMK